MNNRKYLQEEDFNCEDIAGKELFLVVGHQMMPADWWTALMNGRRQCSGRGLARPIIICTKFMVTSLINYDVSLNNEEILQIM